MIQAKVSKNVYPGAFGYALEVLYRETECPDKLVVVAEAEGVACEPSRSRNDRSRHCDRRPALRRRLAAIRGLTFSLLLTNREVRTLNTKLLFGLALLISASGAPGTSGEGGRDGGSRCMLQAGQCCGQLPWVVRPPHQWAKGKMPVTMPGTRCVLQEGRYSTIAVGLRDPRA